MLCLNDTDNDNVFFWMSSMHGPSQQGRRRGLRRRFQSCLQIPRAILRAARGRRVNVRVSSHFPRNFVSLSRCANHSANDIRGETRSERHLGPRRRRDHHGGPLLSLRVLATFDPDGFAFPGWLVQSFALSHVGVHHAVLHLLSGVRVWVASVKSQLFRRRGYRHDCHGIRRDAGRVTAGGELRC